MGRLLNEHDGLRAQLHHFAGLMAQGREAVHEQLLRERVSFSQRLRQHLADEEAQLRTTLGDDPIVKAAAGEMHLLMRDYSAHVTHWTPTRIASDWEGYRGAVLRLQRRLLARMAWEERELHPRLPA